MKIELMNQQFEYRPKDTRKRGTTRDPVKMTDENTGDYWCIDLAILRKFHKDLAAFIAYVKEQEAA